jgi:diacylglycerol kinase (ATP)
MSMPKSGRAPLRSRSLLWSFNYAIQGIVYAFRTQRNMRLHMLAATVVLFGALFFRIGRSDLIALVFTVSFVLVAELANTAIEATIDVATERFDPLAKTAKDVAAGAVLIASINAVAVGYMVFYAHLAHASQNLFVKVASVPLHLTLIALALTGIAVIVAKAVSREGTFMRGGWPSGHTALATAVATGLGYATNSPFVFIGGLFLAALVAQSRVEGEIHTIPQVITGAILGFLVATFVFQVSQVLWS